MTHEPDRDTGRLPAGGDDHQKADEADEGGLADRHVHDHLRELLGFEPGVQLRSLTTGSALSYEESAEEGKYLIERLIGQGGMGKVFLAFDRDLRRHVALKVVAPARTQDREQIARFVEEAQITGQLEHPGIPPVHELAINQKGEVFFTLKLLRGRTLKEILHELHIGRRDARERFSRVRLLQILQAICNAVHFAHEKGVIHRDIKPENIMVGDYGEVQLMDWGLAKVLDRPDRDDELGDSDPEAKVETVRTEQHLVTLAGRVQGTLHYMSPEQAQGRSELVDRRSDVYALGATLYEILTFLPPKTGGSVQELLEEARLGLVIPPSERAPKQRVPEELEEICLKALEYHPDDRHATALELAEEIQVYLDGTLERERRRRESERFLAEALDARKRHDSAKRGLLALTREVEELEEGAGNHPDAETKRRDRELRARRAEEEIAVARLYTQAQTLLAAALAAEPTSSRARRALGELYLERFLRADEEGNPSDLIFYRGLIEQVNDGGFDRVLRGNGSLVLECSVAEAAIRLARIEELDSVLEAATEVGTGTGRLVVEDLPMGSYLATLTAPEHAAASYPIHVRRNRDIRALVRLLKDSEVPPGHVHVPAGEFAMYGDPNVLSTWKHRRQVHVDDFVIRRDHITCGEYLSFLRDLWSHSPAEARRRSPRESEESGHLWIETDDGFRLPPAGRYPWAEDLPVFGVSFEDAEAFCRWLSESTHRRWTLPTEAEWEKAARGVDGRHWAWGDWFDNEFANNLYARADREAGVARDADFPRDVSPYGVRGTVGNLSDWCVPEESERPGMVAVRGGNWALTADPCRLAVRRVTHPRYVSDRIGFRVCRRPFA